MARIKIDEAIIFEERAYEVEIEECLFLIAKELLEEHNGANEEAV